VRQSKRSSSGLTPAVLRHASGGLDVMVDPRVVLTNL
jgi:hypothetical protein